MKASRQLVGRHFHFLGKKKKSKGKGNNKFLKKILMD